MQINFYETDELKLGNKAMLMNGQHNHHSGIVIMVWDNTIIGIGHDEDDMMWMPDNQFDYSKVTIAGF